MQEICCVFPPVTNNELVMDHSLMTGTLYYMLTYIPTHLLSLNYVNSYFYAFKIERAVTTKFRLLRTKRNN